MSLVNKIRYGIINLIRWFPTIWNNRDHDYSYILEVIKFKLLRQSKALVNNRLTTYPNFKYDNDRIMLCVRLIEKIQSEFYLTEINNYHNIKYDIIDNNLSIKIESERYCDYLNQHMSAVRRILKNKELQILPMDSTETINTSLSQNIGIYNHERSKKILFDILKNQMEEWWF
jgi:DNA-binding FrmR family transcriptional regulator